jgi:hypothetical protein
MAAANAYRAKTVTFASTPVLGITDTSITDNGSPVDLSTDASPTITAVFVDSIVTDVNVSTTDLARVSALDVGDTGSLVIVYQLRAEGSGAGAGDKTATMANAVIVSITPQAGTNGIGSHQITFRCSGPNGSTTRVWS